MSAVMADGGPAPGYLPIKPFRQWCERHAANLAGGSGLGYDEGCRALASRLGIGERRLYAIMHESKVISLTVAERLVQAFGELHITDIYPDALDRPLSEWGAKLTCPGCGAHMRHRAPYCGLCAEEAEHHAA